MLAGSRAAGRRPAGSLRRHVALDLLHPCGAIFELGDLAERIELRIGEDVGRRLTIAEGNEDHPRRHVAVGTGRQLDRAPAGGYPDQVAPMAAEMAQVE